MRQPDRHDARPADTADQRTSEMARLLTRARDAITREPLLLALPIGVAMLATRRGPRSLAMGAAALGLGALGLGALGLGALGRASMTGRTEMATDRSARDAVGRDIVDEASEESFPASDPPAYTR